MRMDGTAMLINDDDDEIDELFDDDRPPHDLCDDDGKVTSFSLSDLIGGSVVTANGDAAGHLCIVPEQCDNATPAPTTVDNSISSGGGALIGGAGVDQPPRALSKGKAVVAEARLMIFRVFYFFKREKLRKQQRKHLLPLDMVYEKTALATGLAWDVVQQMVEQLGEGLPSDAYPNFPVMLNGVHRSSVKTQPPTEPQCQELVIRVYRYFRSEFTDNRNQNVNNAILRTARATALSEKMISKIVVEGKKCIENGDVFRTPGTKRNRPSRIRDKLGSDGERLVRQIKQERQAKGQKPPRISEVHRYLQERMPDFKLSVHCLKRILHNIETSESGQTVTPMPRKRVYASNDAQGETFRPLSDRYLVDSMAMQNNCQSVNYSHPQQQQHVASITIPSTSEQQQLPEGLVICDASGRLFDKKQLIDDVQCIVASSVKHSSHHNDATMVTQHASVTPFVIVAATPMHGADLSKLSSLTNADLSGLATSSVCGDDQQQVFELTQFGDDSQAAHLLTGLVVNAATLESMAAVGGSMAVWSTVNTSGEHI